MSSHTKNNTRASILCHLRSPNIRAGYLLNDDHFPYGPFLLLYYGQVNSLCSLFLRGRRYVNGAKLTVVSTRHAVLPTNITVQFSLTRFRAKNDCYCHLVKLLKFKHLISNVKNSKAINVTF
jgi:hypothetical protein